MVLLSRVEVCLWSGFAEMDRDMDMDVGDCDGYVCAMCIDEM